MRTISGIGRMAALAGAMLVAPLGGRVDVGGAPKGYRTINRLNRSRKWRPARDYKHARALSPYPERPVR